MKNVLEYLENTVGKYPEKEAAADDKESCSYRELLEDSQRAGVYLAGYMTPGSGVAVLQKKSVQTLKLFFGIVYAGGFYTLIDPDFPVERIANMLAVLKPAAVITPDENRDKLRDAGFDGIVLSGKELLAGENSESSGKMCACDSSSKILSDIRLAHTPGMPLYCNFTSGSTGMPKGVLVSHECVIGFIDEFTSLFGIGENDVVGNQAPFDFDVSVKDIYSCMKTGAKLVIIPTAFFRFPNNVMDMLEKHNVTTLIWAVSALVLINRLHEFMYKVPGAVNKVLFSGEQMPVKHLLDWIKQYPDAEFVNLYGPTEITCNCSYYRIEKDFDPEKGLPIGYPYPGKEISLLDENDRLIDPSCEDKEGEVCVSGEGLAIGYYNNKEATDKAFIHYELPGKGMVRMYRTGDLALYRGGLLYFAGRKDFQIKHNGHRIELEEIERHLSSVEGILQACCMYDEKRNRIMAFYSAEDPASLDKKTIVEALKVKLPEYMIPNSFKSLDELPLTKNGKIDRRKLREMI